MIVLLFLNMNLPLSLIVLTITKSSTTDNTYKSFLRNTKQAVLMNWFFGVMQSSLFIQFQIGTHLQRHKDSKSWRK